MLFSIVVPPIYIPINSVRAIHYFRYIGLEKYIIKMNFTSFFFPFLMQLPDNSKSHMWLTFVACMIFLLNSTSLNSISSSRVLWRPPFLWSSPWFPSWNPFFCYLPHSISEHRLAGVCVCLTHSTVCKPSGEQAQLPSSLQPSECFLAKPRAGHKQQLSWFSLDELKCNQGRHGEAGRAASEVHPGPKAPQARAAEATS